MNTIARTTLSACRICSVKPIVSLTPSFSSQYRSFTATGSRLAAQQSKKKKKVGPNPDAKTIAEAAQILKTADINRPWSAFEIEVVTKVDKSAPPLRGSVMLPFEARKSEEKILVFAEGEAAEQAREAGATFVGGEELIPKVLSGEIDPSKVIATPALIGPITPKLARYLGQKGLMPSAKRGTVVEDVAQAIKDAKGQMSWRGDKQGHVRSAVARIGFPTEKLEANVKAFVRAVKVGSTAASSALDNTAARKGSSILRVNLGSTMGPSIEIKDAL